MPVSLSDNNRRNRLLLRIAHVAPAICGSTVLIVAVAEFFPVPSLTIPTLSFIGAYAVAVMSIHFHGLRLCPLCAAETPLDGAGRAGARARTLRQAHRVSSKRFSVVFCVMGAVTLAVVFGLGRRTHGNPLAILPIDLILAEGAFQIYVFAVHRPLLRWCPLCHWDDGGDKELVPDPVPPAGVKVLR